MRRAGYRGTRCCGAGGGGWGVQNRLGRPQGGGNGGRPPLRSRHLHFPTVRRRGRSIPSLGALDRRTPPRPGSAGELPSGGGTPGWGGAVRPGHPRIRGSAGRGGRERGGYPAGYPLRDLCPGAQPGPGLRADPSRSREAPGGRTSDVGALALVQLAGGRATHGDGAGGCGAPRLPGREGLTLPTAPAARSWKLVRRRSGLCN